MLFKLVASFVLVYTLNAQLLPPSGIRRVRPGPVIETKTGPIQGQEETYDIFRRIYTYKGIRYAQPPVGNLRFRQGVPPVAWQTTHQAWSFGSECPQFSLLLNRFSGDEDCLFLNIATPTNIRSRLPVVVSFHGGGLQFGNGDFGDAGPELINQENVIYVSFNYRLGVLGFLNTVDANSPGNYGIKDMIMVLQWVQNNIEFFGGNPDDVTIMGISAGAVGVHALVVSNAAAGLFHKALSQSGSLFNSWAFNQNPITSVQRLTANLQLQVTGNQDLVNQLRTVSVVRLLSAAQIPNRLLFQENLFAVSLDPNNSPEVRIFTGPVEFLIRSGNINQVPYVIGFNSMENLRQVSQVTSEPQLLERFNQNPNLLVPTEWNLAPNSQDAQQVISTFRDLYFNGATTITTDMAFQWSNYVSDRRFIFGVSKQARLHQLRQQVYYFRFSYSGALSFMQRSLGLSQFPGAIHADDAFYLFRLNVALTPILPSDEAFTIQRRYVRMWTNFFKYGNPTPSLIDPMIDTVWPTMTWNDEFMDIDRDLQASVHPFQQRMNVWHNFDARFNSLM